MSTALARSINTVAVKLSLTVGREKVLEDMAAMGITHLPKSCSMALGDTGMTPLQHTGGYATFANGGMKVTPYAIEDINNSKGELVYARERDEPKPERIFEQKPIEDLNKMLHAVVMEGTAKSAQLDFTYVAGKTGTSSAYRDAWFVAFTGQYVTGVWFGNDDFKPMGRITGGSLPAQVWKQYNIQAHVNMNIPQIPGLPLHPVQQGEQDRIALERIDDPDVAVQPAATLSMPEDTRETLGRIAEMMREAEQAPPPEAGEPGAEPARAPAGSAASAPVAPPEAPGAASRFVRRP
jgi:penicillin-binding protein 1A